MILACKGSAPACWGARRSPPGWRRGKPASNNGTKAGHGQHGDELSTRSVTQRAPKQHWGALPATPAARFNESGAKRTAPLTVGRRWSRRLLSAEDTRRRGRCSRRRGPGLLLLPRDGVPARLPPTTPSAPPPTCRSAPPPSPPHPHSPSSPLPLAAADRVGGKPQSGEACGMGSLQGKSSTRSKRCGAKMGSQLSHWWLPSGRRRGLPPVGPPPL
jgi:hypothetical protein